MTENGNVPRHLRGLPPKPTTHNYAIDTDDIKSGDLEFFKLRQIRIPREEESYAMPTNEGEYEAPVSTLTRFDNIPRREENAPRGRSKTRNIYERMSDETQLHGRRYTGYSAYAHASNADELSSYEHPTERFAYDNPLRVLDDEEGNEAQSKRPRSRENDVYGTMTSDQSAYTVTVEGIRDISNGIEKPRRNRWLACVWFALILSFVALLLSGISLHQASMIRTGVLTAGRDAMTKDVDPQIETLRAEMEKIKQNTEAQYDKINATRDNDINKLNEKFDDLKTRLSYNFTTSVSYASKKHGLFKQNLDNNLTQISAKMEKLAFNITKLTLFQKKAEENLKKTSTNYSNLLIYLQKDQNDTERRIFTVESKGNVQFDQLRKEMKINATKVFKKLDKLSLDIKKFVNDTSKEILRTSNISNMKLEQFQSNIERNLTTLSQSIQNLAENLQKLDNDTNVKFMNNLNHINKFKQFQNKTETNLTILSQSIQNLAKNLRKLDNDTNVHFVNNLNYINKLFVPSKLRGPRGHNGTRGSRGLLGPAGPRGPTIRIDFSKCKYSNASMRATAREPKTTTTAKDKQNQIVIPVSCKSSIQGAKAKLSSAVFKPTGFVYYCTCDNVRPRQDFTCTINYVLCDRN